MGRPYCVWGPLPSLPGARGRLWADRGRAERLADAPEVREASMSFRPTLLLAVALMVPAPAAFASSCYSIRDSDTRMTCLALERGERSTCNSVRNADQRALCSVQADQAKRLKAQERR